MNYITTVIITIGFDTITVITTSQYCYYHLFITTITQYYYCDLLSTEII